MPKLNEAELLARDAERDLNAELLEAARDMREGKAAKVCIVSHNGRVIDSPVALARIRTKLSQAAFASLMGVSKRTLQEWEQGRRKPSKAAQTLLRIAEQHPEVLRELNNANRLAM